MRSTPIGELYVDSHEIYDIADNIAYALNHKVSPNRISSVIDPGDILIKHGVPIGLMILTGYTPVGDDDSNWGYWDYGSYHQYASDHRKGTLRRGWLTTDEAEAFVIDIPETWRYAYDFAKTHYKPIKKYKTHFYVDLENCVSYGTAVEYGHRVVFPFEAENQQPHVKGSIWNGKPIKRPAHNRYVPGQFFVRRCVNSNAWKAVTDSMHKEYIKRLRAIYFVPRSKP